METTLYHNDRTPVANCRPDRPLGSYTGLALTYAFKGSFGSVDLVVDEWSGQCCVLGQDTLLSHCLFPPRCIWYQQNLYAGGY